MVEDLAFDPSDPLSRFMTSQRHSTPLHLTSTSTISDALDDLKRPGVIDGVQPLVQSETMTVGPAHIGVLHESSEPGIAGLAEFLDSAPKGSFLVLVSDSEIVASTFGGLAAVTATRQGCVGLLTMGWIRDVPEIASQGFPVWGRGHTPRSGKLRLGIRRTEQEVRIGATRVEPGDVIAADATGVCVIPTALSDEISQMISELHATDIAVARMISSGMSFQDATARAGTP